MVDNFPFLTSYRGRLPPKSMTRRLVPLSHPRSMPFYHVPLPWSMRIPRTYKYSALCIIYLKLVLDLPLAIYSPCLSSPLGKTFVCKGTLPQVLASSLDCRYDSLDIALLFFSIAYWEEVGLFVSIARPRSRKKGIRLCRSSVLNNPPGPVGWRL